MVNILQCSDLKEILPLYFDAALAARENVAIESHLDSCPLCRQKLDEYRSVRSRLASSTGLSAPKSLHKAIRIAVAMELGATATSPQFRLVETKRDWIKVWLMPFSVGGLATAILAVATLWFILNSVNPYLLAENNGIRPSNPNFLTALGTPSPGEYASSRSDVGYESPSLNPQGSLVQVTKLLVSDEIKDDEVVVVADVFENGSAQIAEVVEPPRNRKAAREIERAFNSDLAYAPFVPAGMDQRSDRVRVVFRIQSVSVDVR